MKRVLIFRVGSVGDTVVALPSLRWVSEAFPEARRCLLTNLTENSRAAPTAALLDGTGLIHEYIEYPIALRSLTALFRLRKKIRAFRPDVLVYLAEPRGLLKTLRDAAFFKWCGIRALVGVPYRRDMRLPRRLNHGMFENEAVRLARCLGVSEKESVGREGAFELNLRDSEREKALGVLGQFDYERPLLAVSIGAKLELKDWGSGKWKALLANLRPMLPAWNVVAIGVGEEREATRKILESWGRGALNLCGQLNIRESAAVLERANLFIGHDSGPMHVAAAVGTRCVAVFSSRNLPGEWYPCGREHRIVYHSMPCQGCRLEVCRQYGNSCIASIQVDEVVRAVRDALGFDENHAGAGGFISSTKTTGVV